MTDLAWVWGFPKKSRHAWILSAAEGCTVATTNEVQAATDLLRHKLSAKRRAGAKRLRKLGRPEAGPALLVALREELRDTRTWETQYQMVMALAESEYTPALPYLEELAQQSFEATMVYTALGDALVRLGRSSSEDAEPVLRLLRSGNERLIDGALRAVAMLRLTLDQAAVERIVAFASALPPADGLRFWVAAAAPGWRGPAVEAFLGECVRSPREDVREAAAAAVQGKYRRWSPL